MAEISEPPNPIGEISETSGISPETASDIDLKTMRTTKPGLKRLFITLSVFVSFLLGLPFLWKSVEIYRSPLPFRDIDILSDQIEKQPLAYPCMFQAIFIGYKSENPDRLQSLILSKMTKLAPETQQCGTCSNNSSFSLSVTVQENDSHCTGTLGFVEPSCSYTCGSIRALDFVDDSEGDDEMLNDVLSSCSGFGGKVYTVVVVNRDGLEEVRAVVGKRRHAWIVGSGMKESENEMADRVAEIMVKVFVNGGKEEGPIHGEFMPVGSDGKIVLSFNLLNADPRDWVYDWDFQSIDDTLLAPLIEALGPIANISVESQVLYHTPKASFSYWDENRQSYIFSTKDLPFFVNSNEWHLDTSIAAGGRSKILHFVVYVPSAQECPLLLQLPNGDISETKGFISPMWGGVIVWNPSNCLKDSESYHLSKHLIPYQDLEQVFQVFMGQFRQIFGLKSDEVYVGTSGTFKILPNERGFSQWELDVLSRQHTCFNLHSCATTLGSLSRLVQSLPRMIIKDEIGKQVRFSLEAAKLAQTTASLGDLESSAVSSRQARSLAEDAFFHPSMMSVSYYSFEHCFAVYSPFFLPVSMHILLAALREFKRHKQEKAKYLAWKTTLKSV